jgi:two-component system alkaline phosphatase synthesis response regulator PhoP
MTPKNKHIVIVEDEEHLAIGIKFNLEAEGYRVTNFKDGTSALTMIQENFQDVDLLILDLMLPGMSGYNVCETLRGHGWDKPVLILSARTLPDDRKRGFDVGANQYLSKPFELDELISRVRNLLTHFRPRVDAPLRIARYEFGKARINFETFEATCDGSPIRMTPLEMKLLQYFIEHQGRVIPRQELLENVWGLHGQVQTRAPDQFIRRLRKAFEPDPANPRHILTIRDAGYRFVAEPSAVPEVGDPGDRPPQ